MLYEVSIVRWDEQVSSRKLQTLVSVHPKTSIISAISGMLSVG